MSSSSTTTKTMTSKLTSTASILATSTTIDENIDHDDSIDGEGSHSAPATPNVKVNGQINYNNIPSRFLSDPEIQSKSSSEDENKQSTQVNSNLTNVLSPNNGKEEKGVKSKSPSNKVTKENESHAYLSIEGNSPVKLRSKQPSSSFNRYTSPSMRILCPRLCHIRKWANSTYGFNLVSKKGETGHYIDNLEEGFPGFYAGLRNGDRVIEVNSTNVVELHHNEVVKMIRESTGDGIKLLVVDEETEKYFQRKGYSISSDKVKAQVKFIACPAERPMSAIFDYEKPSTSSENKDNTPELTHFGIESDPDSTHDLSSSSPLPDRQVDSVTTLNENKRHTYSAETKTSKEVSTFTKQLRRLSMAGTAATTKIAETWSKSHHVPRLCLMTEIPPKGEYGFVLRTYLDSNEQQVVKVEKNSVADRSGVQEKDLVIEINGINISNENHVQVTNRIKNTGSQLSLLVLTPKDFLWYKKQKKIPKASEAIVIKTTPRDSTSEKRDDQLDDDIDDDNLIEQPIPVNSQTLYSRKSVDYVDVEAEIEEMEKRRSNKDDQLLKPPFLLKKPPRRQSGPLTVERVVHHQGSTTNKSSKGPKAPVEEFELRDYTSTESEWSDPSSDEAFEKEASSNEKSKNIQVKSPSNGGTTVQKRFHERAI